MTTAPPHHPTDAPVVAQPSSAVPRPPSNSNSESDDGTLSRSSKSAVPEPETVSSDTAETKPGFKYNPGSRKFEGGKYRQKWFQVWRPKDPPPPPPASLDDAKLIPLANANWINKIFFAWMTPIMILGYQRPLESTDLWAMSEDLSAKRLGDRLQSDWERRVREAKAYNEKMESGEIQPGWRQKTSWTIRAKLNRKGGTVAQREKAWRAPPKTQPKESTAKPGQGKPAATNKLKDASGHKRPSLVWAMHDQLGWNLWSGLFFKIIGDTALITSPLVLKAIIKYAQELYAAHRLGLPTPNVGRGVGLSFALFFMQALSSLCTHQFFWRSMSCGVEARAALITSIFDRAMKMNGKSRSSAKLINHISTDCSRIDFASAWFTIIFAAPIQMAICVAILITQLGPSALAGFAIFFLSTPLLGKSMKALFSIRRSSMKWTDARAKAIQEVLSGMRIVKSFSHESKWLQRIYDIRKSELNGIRKILIIRSATIAIAFSLPVLAAVLAFVVYSLTGHDLNPAIVFPGLTLFQLLRMPLMFLPLSLSATTDARNAFDRLYTVFTAEQLEDAFEYDDESKFALIVRDGGFRWETAEVEEGAKAKGKKSKDSKGSDKRHEKDAANAKPRKSLGLFRKAVPSATEPGLPAPASAKHTSTDNDRRLQELKAEKDAGVADDGTNEALVTDIQMQPKEGEVVGSADGADEDAAQEPFSMTHLNVSIPKGELVAIVGPVGCGKSSFLQACIGEMRKTSGTVKWGSERVAYCSQSAWIQNATLRDNILFGQAWDEERYWNAVHVAELEADLAILPGGDLTEIGEKGVNLSGGQKQRVNIARALYYNAEIVCLDDPLSAVDAHVGKALFHNAIMGLRNKGHTVLLVTHALHFLPDVDRIITLEDGRIVEMGTYDELNNANGPFQRLVLEFGGDQEKEEEEKKEDEADAIEGKGKKTDRSHLSGTKDGNEGALMQAEERNTGSVALQVYVSYFKFGRGIYMLPLCIGSLALMQASNILNSYWLIWWQENKYDEPIGFYMGIYAMLGIVMTIFTFVMGCAMGFLSYYACKKLHHEAIQRVVYAPMAWLDVTPVGRIMNRFAKDVDVVDNQLADAVRMAANTLASVIGAVILITILTHYFVIAVAAVLVFYFFGALFYRSSAREVKRLDAILRSSLYSHFSETLSGLATIRAYRETDTFIKENQKRMDVENRAYYLSITNQRWLGVRLDMLGALLVLIVALLTTASSTPITGGNAGIALTYMLTVAQSFSWMTRQIAEVENDCASVERLLYYAEELEQEKAQVREDNPVRESWPEEGRIEFKDIWLNYRPGLPSVLKGITFSVGSGEKVGIVGRTGAGKSSLLTALLRLVELSKGSVEIDGVDVANIGLEDLRRKLAILPQEPLLFSGTLRSNLDPFGIYDDARLNDALKRSYLISDDTHTQGASTPIAPPVGEPTDDGEKEKLDVPGDATPGKAVSRIKLDTVIEEEGSNLSVGQRSLVSLARALVKNSKIILLDEATASVDLETDSKIQQTIREEFANRTILCIAHRLRTILAYDRIAVFDHGTLAEYASPLDLFDRPDGIFHSMCERSNITREEILRNAKTAPFSVSE